MSEEVDLTPDEDKVIRTAATYFVFDWGKRHEMLRVFFNSMINECNKRNISHESIFHEFIDNLGWRLDGPQTPDEFNDLYRGGDD